MQKVCHFPNRVRFLSARVAAHCGQVPEHGRTSSQASRPRSAHAPCHSQSLSDPAHRAARLPALEHLSCECAPQVGHAQRSSSLQGVDRRGCCASTKLRGACTPRLPSSHRLPREDTACPEVLTARRPRQEQRSTTTPGARAFERAASSCATSRVRRRRDPITSANLASNRQRSLGPGCSRPRVRCAAQLQSQPQCHRPCLHTHDARCAPLAGCPFLASGTRSVWQADHNQFAP